MTGIFSLIILLLKATRLWEKFLDHVDTLRRLERAKESEERGIGLGEAQSATTPEEAYAAQDRITRNMP